MKLVKISDIFTVKYGNSFELINMTEVDSNEEDSVNFISRTEKNNGISAFVEKNDTEPFPGGTISVAVGGSVLSTFLQRKPYYTGFHVMVLFPKKDMSDIELLFYCYCIRQNKYRYNYGRQANKTLKDIEIPESMPQERRDLSIEKINTLNNNVIISKDFELNCQNWKEFKISDIFTLNKCKCSSATDLLEQGNDIYYIGAKKKLNGVMEKVSIEENLVTQGNCIVFIGDGQGSVGFVNYQPKDFIGSTTLTAGYNENLNKYNAMFLVTVLDCERYRYNFGRKYGKEQLQKVTIKLPATEHGLPDWELMENYIKSLPYSASL